MKIKPGACSVRLLPPWNKGHVDDHYRRRWRRSPTPVVTAASMQPACPGSAFPPTSLTMPLYPLRYPPFDSYQWVPGPLLLNLTCFLLDSLTCAVGFHHFLHSEKPPSYILSLVLTSTPSWNNHLPLRSFCSNFPLTAQFQTLKNQNDRMKQSEHACDNRPSKAFHTQVLTNVSHKGTNTLINVPPLSKLTTCRKQI